MARRLQQSDLEHPYLKLLLYGQPGSTKTRTSATAAMDPRTAPCLMLEQAGNPISIRHYEKKPDIVHIDKLDEYNPFYEWLRAGQPADAKIVAQFELNPPYKCLIIDGITEVQRYSFRQVVGTTQAGPGTIPATAEIQHFNKVLAQMITFANLFFGLSMHVIMTSLEREDRDESTGTIMYKPLLWGQSSGEVGGYALAVARLVHRARLDHRTEQEVNQASKLGIIEDAIQGTTVSVALFRPSGKYVAKDQYGSIGPYMADPSIPKLMDNIYGKTTSSQA